MDQFDKRKQWTAKEKLLSEEAKVRHAYEAIVSSGRNTDLIGRNGSVKIPKIDHNDSDVVRDSSDESYIDQ